MSFPFEGNSALKTTVEGVLNSGRMPHAFLIECANGGEGTELARYIAQAAVCAGEKRPCGICRGCRAAIDGNHPDISVIQPENGKKTISVATVRQIRADAYIKPHSADGRVFIIDGAHRMNVQSQNALLKVLEEPPVGVVFILTVTSRTELLETVRSRCTLITINSSDEEKNSKASVAAKKFVELLFDGSELELLTLLYPFEKDRVGADEFFDCLERELTAAAKRELGSRMHMKIIYKLFGDIKDYKAELMLNANLSLLFATLVCRVKSYRDL